MLTFTDGLDQTTRWDYNQFGWAMKKTDAAGQVAWTNFYNGNGWLIKHWTPGKLLTQYGYDEVGNLTSIDYPSMTDVELRYDANNRLTNVVDGAGTTSLSWTAVGGLEREDGPWASDAVAYGYNDSGLRQSLTLEEPNGSWDQAYTYDSSWRVATLTAPSGTFTYTYRGPANLVTNLEMRLATSSMKPAVTNDFDGAGRLVSTVLKAYDGTVLNSHSYEYNAAHQRRKQTFKEGNWVEYGYDAVGQLISALGKQGTTSRLNEQFRYEYDAAGNLTTRTNNDLIQTYGVNSLNELASVSRNAQMTVAGAFSEPVSSLVVNGQAATVYADKTYARAGVPLVNGNNTISAVATSAAGVSSTAAITLNLPTSVSLSYDLNGNLTGDGKRSFEYDDENRLVAVQVAGVWRTEMVYDAFGRLRVRREDTWNGSGWAPSVTDAETRYVYDGSRVVQERDGVNAPIATYTRGLDLSGSLEGAGGIGGLLARTDRAPSGIWRRPDQFYHSDGSGNVTAVMGDQQLLSAKYRYDSFGNVIGSWGPLAEVNPYHFSSKEFHSRSGLIYFGSRWYDPNLQRWLNRDPIGEAGGVNLYGFAGNDPINNVDPLGECWNPFDPEFWGDIFGKMAGVGKPHNIDPNSNLALLGDYGGAPEGYKDSSGNPVSGAKLAGIVGGAVVAGAISAATDGAGKLGSNAKKPIVIGENMKDRVIPAAKKLGADYYKPRSTIPENWLKNNMRWLKDKIKGGRKVIDIGPDPNRAVRSPYYQAERALLEKSGCPVETP